MISSTHRVELIGGSPLVHARLAGFTGLVVLATGSFAGMVASRLIVRDDAMATASNVVASESLFRLGIVGSLVMMLAWMVYALLLYRLLRVVNKSSAMTMFGLVLVSVPIYMLNQVNMFGVLLAASDHLNGQVELFLALGRFGSLIAAIFFGLWLYPLGLLVYKSSFLPRFLGLLLMFGSLGYLILFVQGSLFPASEHTLWTNPFLVLTHLSELALLLWLLVKGVNVDRWDERAHGVTTS